MKREKKASIIIFFLFIILIVGIVGLGIYGYYTVLNTDLLWRDNGRWCRH